MKTTIIGGTFGTASKPSGVVRKMAECFDSPAVINGGLTFPDTVDGDLIVWMPNITNESPKAYPKKPTGAVLVCSKLMHDGVSKIDAIARIFKMHGNAVICIYPKPDGYEFEILDALGNSWYSGNDIKALCSAITSVYGFTKEAVRVPSFPSPSWISEDLYLEFGIDRPDMERLLDINGKLASKIMTQCGNRFFGNVSTRCQNLFPTIRSCAGIYVSPRNSDKASLTYKDMILCTMENGFVAYHNGGKPSVDTPVQLSVYEKKPDINFMIHGHAFIVQKQYPFFTGSTENYRLCGDLREADEILPVIGASNCGALTLKNHGFLLFSDTLESLDDMAGTCEFKMRKL